MSVDLRSEAAGIKPVKEKKKLGRGVASFLILFFILAALVSIFAFNLFNIRDHFIFPFLSRIPIVSSIVPSTDDMYGDLGAMSKDDMRARINELEELLYIANRDISDASDIIDRNEYEIERLMVFEEQQLTFKRDKADFDMRIALGDPQAYVDFFESVFPENAELLYPRAVAESSRASDIRKYMSDIAHMDETSAANAIQTMAVTDMPLVVSIMHNMDSRRAGGILSEMDSQNAASIMKMMAPFSASPVSFSAFQARDNVNMRTVLPTLQ